MNKNQTQISSSDTIFNDNSQYINEDRFKTPPPKTISQTQPQSTQKYSPYRQNLATIFKTPTSIKCIEQLSGSKTLIKSQMGDVIFQKNLLNSEQTFQRKLPMTNFDETQNEKKTVAHEDIIVKAKQCNCKKTKCLKLYCDCFASGELCGVNCSCSGCYNNQVKIQDRSHVVENLLEKNPNAFTGKISKDSQVKSGHIKGCNCRKSGCQKKYCECFSAGVKCNELCKCETCKNFDFDKLNNMNVRKISQLLNPQGNQNPIQTNGFLVIPTNNQNQELFKQFLQNLQTYENDNKILPSNQKIEQEQESGCK